MTTKTATGTILRGPLTSIGGRVAMERMRVTGVCASGKFAGFVEFVRLTGPEAGMDGVMDPRDLALCEAE